MYLFNNKAQRIAAILAATKSVIQSQTYIQINTEDILVYVMRNVHTAWETCINHEERAYIMENAHHRICIIS